MNQTAPLSPLDAVQTISLPGKEIFLVGTAHISPTSVVLAQETIRSIKPDSVAIELCAPRYQALRDPERWKNTDILKVIREGKSGLMLAQLLLAGFQKKLGDKLKVRPGAEMLAAADTANEVGSTLVFVDREVKITLKRVWSKLTFFQMLKVFWSLLVGALGDHSIDEAELEKLKSGDSLQELMKEFSAKFPGVEEALIHERDIYLAQKIKQAPGAKIVAVVGAGHVPGILREIYKDNDLAPLEIIPPKKKIWKILGWGVTAAVLTALMIGFMQGNSASLLGSWVLLNGGAAAFGSLISLAHPLTILVAFITAPIANLNPLISAGWTVGLCEAIVRKPKVHDVEGILDDIGTFKGFYKNRLLHILLIMAVTNLCAKAASIVGFKEIFGAVLK